MNVLSFPLIDVRFYLTVMKSERHTFNEAHLWKVQCGPSASKSLNTEKTLNIRVMAHSVELLQIYCNSDTT